jgi:hypothetical protein
MTILLNDYRNYLPCTCGVKRRRQEVQELVMLLGQADAEEALVGAYAQVMGGTEGESIEYPVDWDKMYKQVSQVEADLSSYGGKEGRAFRTVSGRFSDREEDGGAGMESEEPRRIEVGAASGCSGRFSAAGRWGGLFFDQDGWIGCTSCNGGSTGQS